jgi:hypothetical protein
MDRRNFFGYALPVLAAAVTPLLAMGQDDDRREKHGDKHGDKRDDGRHDRYFRDQDTAYLRQRYASQQKDLPPGLRKKYYRTGKLPPGWEKRFRPFPQEVIVRLPPPPPNCERGYIDGYAVVYDRRTRIITDIIDIIGAATGR